MIDGFHQIFVARLMRIVALGAACSPVAAAAGCGGNVIVDVPGGGGAGQGGQGGAVAARS